MATINWDETSPADTDQLKDGASEIRDDKQAVRERATQGGHVWNDSLTTDGRHAVNVDGSGEFRVFKSDKSSVALHITDTYIRPDATVEYQDSSGNPLTQRYHSVAFTIGGTLTTGRTDIPAIQCSFLESGETATLKSVKLTVLTSPTGSALTVDLLRCPAASDPTVGGNWSSVMSSKPSIAAGGYEGSSSSFSTSTLNPDDRLVINVDTVGSTIAGSDLTVMVQLEF